ncbi:MAG: 4,5-DOPA dioxygenase extradiol [Christensenellales bacterium]|jgi:4,5-DOPA dioxygenase extradiol
MKRMPVLFVGHGSPMNAIEENEFRSAWIKLGPTLPRPEAILSVSAHWFTPGTKVLTADPPQTIYDMYGFPEELYRVVYSAPGAPALAHKTKELITSREVDPDSFWGLDHGTWSVLCNLYPKADIPVFQLSIDMDAPMEEHFKIGTQLQSLRDQGVLIMGSGNVVHNLARVNWRMEGGYDWAEDFDLYIKQSVLNRDFDNVIDYKRAGNSASLAFKSIDHYAPLLYALGAAEDSQKISVFNDACQLGSISMTSYLLE